MEVRIALKRIFIIWIIVMILVTVFGKISIAESNAGRTAADFLTIGVGARPSGMGGAFTSISEGAQAAYWNPAGLATVHGGEVLLGHFNWYQDISLEHGTFAHQIGDNAGVAFSITYLNYGTINRYDNSGLKLSNDITAYDWAGALSIGLNTSDNFSVGVSAKYINQKIDDISGSAIAADLGFKYIFNTFAVAGYVGNLGTKMKFQSVEEKLPLTTRLGVSFYPFSQNLVTSIDIEKNHSGNMIIRNGFEANYNEQYFLRTGYNYYANQSERSFGSGISFGAGVQLKAVEFDYAFTPSEKYTKESLHRFSFIFKFGQ